MFAFMKKMKSLLPANSTLPGRAEALRVPEKHFVNGNRIVPPFPDGMERAVFGLGEDDRQLAALFAFCCAEMAIAARHRSPAEAAA